MTAPIVLDSGAVIAFEREKRAFLSILASALRRGLTLCVPSVVVAETWRGGRRSARTAMLFAMSRIEPLHEGVARAAAEARAAVRRSTTIDAIVVATAERVGGAVVTSDPDDLEALAAHFGSTPIVAI